MKAAQTLVIDPASARASTKNPNSFRLRRVGEMISAPTPMAWLVDGVFERNSVVMLVGAPASGKSFVAIDIAACIATGTPWQRSNVVAGPVVYLAGEGHRGIHRRFCAWQVARGISLVQAPIVVSERGADLVDAIELAIVTEAVEEFASACGAPALIVVDTMHRHFSGNENDAAEVGQLLRNLDLLREPYGATLALVHHTGHGSADRARGTSSIRATLDTEMLVARADRIVTVKSSKQKDAEPFEDVNFELCTVELPQEWNGEDGSTTTSAVLRRTAAAPTSECVEKPIAGAKQKEALAVLEQLYAENRQRLVDAGRDPDEALVRIDDWRTSLDIDRRRWPEVRDSLVERGQVVLEPPHAILSRRPK